jgi:hypothetical protein
MPVIYKETPFFTALILMCQFSIAQMVDKSNINDSDKTILSKLNTRFINNFITQDTISHNQIVHKDFVCIESSGTIVGRKEYMTGWATGYKDSGYATFKMTDEFIRVFGNMALIRSRTVYTKLKNGATINGETIYTDTYVKENGKWQCVQAQITPIKH